MKSVLISIQPKWCELIASGKKTVEVRKTKPKLETPFKVYIYQTKHREHNGPTYSDGKVIGEFMCDKIFTIQYRCGSYRCEGLTVHENDRIAAASQLSLYDMRNYLSCNGGYAWHISDLVIYKRPKLLGWFQKPCICKNEYEGEEYSDCFFCDLASDSDYGIIACNRPIKKPPQSWCYVEEVE